MKIKSAQLSPQTLSHMLRTVVVVADPKRGVIIRSRPKRTKPRTLLQEQYSTRFGLAGIMASNPEPMQLQTAKEMAKGTEQVPRDILTMAALGRYYDIIGPDGVEWGHVEGPVWKNPYRYWRILIKTNQGFYKYSGLSDLEFRVKADGQNIANGDWATASSIYQNNPNYYPSNLFDGNINTIWATNNVAFPHWVQVEFPDTGHFINQILMTAQPWNQASADQAPGRFSVQYSENGTNWITAWEETNIPRWTPGETRIYTNPEPLLPQA